MSGSALYDDDIVLWSEEQARILRSLASTPRKLPNELDLENVVEEIESVGRSEFAAVESYIQLVMEHAIKLYAGPGAAAARHWRHEIHTFGGRLNRRFAPSMAQRLDLDRLWRMAVKGVSLELEDGDSAVALLPAACPFALRDFLSDDLDGLALADELARVTCPASASRR